MANCQNPNLALFDIHTIEDAKAVVRPQPQFPLYARVEAERLPSPGLAGASGVSRKWGSRSNGRDKETTVMKHAIRNIQGLLLWLTLLALSFAGTAPAAVSSRTVNEGGKELVVIANDSLELTFEPARGGRCNRFVFQDNGEQIIGGAEVCGMFLDHWAKYTWPSGLMWLPYQFATKGGALPGAKGDAYSVKPPRKRGR
jgi:hypothetical protein